MWGRLKNFHQVALGAIVVIAENTRANLLAWKREGDKDDPFSGFGFTFLLGRRDIDFSDADAKVGEGIDCDIDFLVVLEWEWDEFLVWAHTDENVSFRRGFGVSWGGMKAFYLLISCLLASLASAQEVEWYDAEGNVVRVLAQDESSAELEKKEPLFKDAYQWDARRIWRKSHLRGRAIYGNSSYINGYGFGYSVWPNYYQRSQCRNGSYYQSYCRPSHYRGSSLNIVISR